MHNSSPWWNRHSCLLWLGERYRYSGTRTKPSAPFSRRACPARPALTILPALPLLLAAAPFQISTGATGVDPSQFRITAFASNLPYYPTGFLQLPDNSYLVAANDPGPTGYYASTSRLIRLTDFNHDGIADDAGTTLASNLPGAIVQMRLSNNLLVLNSAKTNANSISVLRLGPTAASPIITIGTLNMAFPSGASHTSYALALRPSGIPGEYELYFNLGSRLNATNSTGYVSYPILSGLTGGSLTYLRPESVWRVTLTDTGATPTISNPRLIATGLRNAAGLTFHPTTGDLYLQDNGIDGLSNPNTPLSADEINLIPSSQVGALPEPHFGFATDYIRYSDGARIGSGATQPLATFLPHPGADGTTSHAQGAAEITFAPANFPAPFNAGLFVGFHGKFHQAGLTNDENPVLFFDPATNSYFDFLPNSLPNIGHIDNLHATQDSLFLIDINSLGPVNSPTPSGAIYQITPIPEPTLALLPFLTPFLSRRRRP